MLQKFNIIQTERVSIIKNWLGGQVLQCLETLIKAEQERCSEEEKFI